MAAKGALKRLLPVLRLLVGRHTVSSAQDTPRSHVMSMRASLTSLQSLPGSQLLEVATSIVQVLPSYVLARHKEDYFE